MLIKIRKGVFETNSSSVHTMTICSKEEFEKFKKGELLFDEWKEKLITKEELIENYDYTDEEIENGDFEVIETYNNFFNNGYLETYEESYTTKSGDEIIVFGKFGSDF